MKNQRRAYAFGLMTVLLWSTVATAFKLSLRHLEPVQLLLYANVTSILVLLALLAFRGDLRLIASTTRKQGLRSLGLGILNPFLYYLVLFEAYDRLPAQEAQPLNYTWAITLSLLSIPLLRQKITLRDLLAATISYAGVVVISTRGDVLSLQFSDAWGVALALGSTVIWALYWIYNTRDDRDPVVALLLSFVFGLPFVFVACLLLSTPWVTSGFGLAGAIYVGVFEMGLTFVLWLYALRLSENTARVSQLIFLSPFLSLVFIRFGLDEPILPSTYVGLCLIVGGLLARGRDPRTPSEAESSTKTS
jgi:drug/metabolite transporter (DMT)-like permease